MSGARGLGYFYQLLAMVGWSSLPWLWTLPQPTLVLMGRDDPLVPVVNGRILARLIPNARLVRVENASHWIPHDTPEIFANEVAKFLET